MHHINYYKSCHCFNLLFTVKLLYLYPTKFWSIFHDVTINLSMAFVLNCQQSESKNHMNQGRFDKGLGNLFSTVWQFIDTDLKIHSPLQGVCLHLQNTGVCNVVECNLPKVILRQCSQQSPPPPPPFMHVTCKVTSIAHLWPVYVLSHCSWSLQIICIFSWS